MKSLRHVTILAFGVIIVPFLGVPTGWKQIIFVVIGAGILVSTIFIKRAILTCSHKEEADTSGTSFKDSDYTHEKETEVIDDSEILENQEQLTEESYEG